MQATWTYVVEELLISQKVMHDLTDEIVKLQK